MLGAHLTMLDFGCQHPVSFSELFEPQKVPAPPGKMVSRMKATPLPRFFSPGNSVRAHGAETLPFGSIKAHHLELLDHAIVGRTRVDRHTGKQQ